MRESGAKFVDNLRRLASVLATLIIGVVFAMVTSVNAAPLDKKFEVKDKEKIEKVEEIEEIEELEEVEGIEVEDFLVLKRIFVFDNKIFIKVFIKKDLR